MKIEDTIFSGCYLISPQIFSDDRGHFLESYNKKKYNGIIPNTKFVQDNFSFSKKHVLRGMHFQKNNPQGKLVSVVSGKVLDVVIDLRHDSETYLRWQAFELDGVSKKQLWIPENFAHGFLVLSDTAYFHYKCTALYDPNDEYSIRWNDPMINIDWGDYNEFSISPKDMHAPLIKDYDFL